MKKNDNKFNSVVDLRIAYDGKSYLVVVLKTGIFAQNVILIKAIEEVLKLNDESLKKSEKFLQKLEKRNKNKNILVPRAPKLAPMSPNLFVSAFQEPKLK